MYALVHFAYCSPTINSLWLYTLEHVKQIHLVDSCCITCPTGYSYSLVNGWDVGLEIVKFIPYVFVGVSLCSRLELRLMSLLLVASERGSLLRKEEESESADSVVAKTMFLWAIFSWHNVPHCLHLVASSAGIYCVIPHSVLLTIIINNNCSPSNHKEKIWLITLPIPLKIELFYVLKNTVFVLKLWDGCHDS